MLIGKDVNEDSEEIEEDNLYSDQDSLKEANKLKKLALYIKGLRPILLSHHPNCEEFYRHTIKIGKHRFCIGCYIGYPTAVFGVILIFILNFMFHFTSEFLFVVGVVLMSSFFLSPLKLTKIKIIKIIQKILFNLGSAFLFWWIWTLPNPFIINFFLFFQLFGILLLLVNVYHSLSFYKICKKCKYNLDWDNCPGFKELFEHCDNNNLPNLFKLIKK